MAKIDIITTSGLTAGDGSMLASGATIKFSSEFMVGNTLVVVRPLVYRNRELFESGYMNVSMNPDVIPTDFILDVPVEEYYVLTPANLYQLVCDYLNENYGDCFTVEIITE